jgi:alcohol dehydrogenase
VPYADNMLVKIPANKPAIWFPSASDNIADAHRTVSEYISQDGTSKVLIIGGYDSVPLYAVEFALSLGAAEVTYCTTDKRAADNAQRLGANTELVSTWPDRLAAHDVTVCAIEDPGALSATIRSTKPGGHCTSVAIFSNDALLPMREMYMRGIHFHTGRVNGAHVHEAAIQWIASGLLNPLSIDCKVVTFAELIPALLERNTAKLIATSE